MPFGKKELRLLAVLCLVAYALVFYKLIWQSTLPSVRSTIAEIAAAREKIDLLEKDYQKLDIYKSQLAMQTTSNERIDEYLMNSANMVDSLEYVDKLARLIGDQVKEMNIGKPEQKQAGNGKNPVSEGTELKDAESGNTYYEIKMDIRAFMTYSSAMELVRYIEGGTRRVKITKFFVKSLSDTDSNKLTTTVAGQANKTGPTTAVTTAAVTINASPQTVTAFASGEKIFDTNMTISLYSTNLRASDRMYEYSRHKLNRFIVDNGILLTSTVGSDITSASIPASSLEEEFGSSDLIIREKSYLTAGENLQIYGVDRDNSILRLKSDGTTDVHISLIGKTYFIDTFQNGKKSLSLTGNLPDKNVVTMSVSVDMPDIKENKNIRLNIKITNNSGKDFNISLKEKQKRVTVRDRNGNKIYSNSTSENVRIL